MAQSRRSLRSLAALLGSLALAACGSPPTAGDASSAPKAGAASAKSADPACASWPVISDLEGPERARIEAFAARIETSVNDGDTAPVLERLDGDAMAARAAKGPDISDAERTRLAEKGNAISKAVLRSILKAIAATGPYRLVRAAKLDGEPAAIFRAVGEDGAFEYYVWLVKPDGEANFKVIDVYLLIIGRSMSSIVRDGVRKATGAKQAALCPRAILMTDFAQATLALDISRLSRLLDEMEKLPADDPAKASLLLDRLVERRRFAEAKAALAAMDRRIGGDPFLWVLQGNILFMEGNAEAAKAEMERAIKADPTIAEAYLSLIGISLKEKRFADTARWLTALRKQGGEVAEIEEVPEYAEFVRSPEHAAMKVKWTRETDCNSLIAVLHSLNEMRNPHLPALEAVRKDPGVFKAAARVSDEAARELAKHANADAELKTIAPELQIAYEKYARAFDDVASGLEAKNEKRVAQAITRWEAAIMVEYAALKRLSAYCDL